MLNQLASECEGIRATLNNIDETRARLDQIAEDALSGNPVPEKKMQIYEYWLQIYANNLRNRFIELLSDQEKFTHLTHGAQRSACSLDAETVLRIEDEIPMVSFPRNALDFRVGPN